MSTWLKILIIILVLAILGVGGYFVYANYFAKKEVQPFTQEKLELDPKKAATHLSKVADTENAYWMRGGFDLFWNEVEPEKGELDWSPTDEKVKALNQNQVYVIPIVKPFANWDQDTCHPESKYEADYDPQKGGKVKVGAPCDMTAYAEFLEKAIERYDGDGQDDMPGLTIPIKYWEIMNEPSMQGGSTGGVGEELKFFVGTSQEYLDILKTSYETIKKADPEAKVLHAGMAGMQQNFQDFWKPIFAAGAGNYFDIANIHTINTDEKRNDMYVIKFRKFLEQYELQDKPIFVTEVQFGELTETPTDLASFEKLIVKSSVFAMTMGADKLFYIDNWLFWQEGGFSIIQEKEDEKKNEKEDMHKLNPEALNGSTHKVYLNLVDKINQFEKIEKIKKEYVENQSDSDGATSNIGQYKFISGSKIVYVLWGGGNLPAEIKGKIKVTDIYGETQQTQAGNLTLRDEPVFVEIL